MDKSTHEARLARWKQIIEQCQARPKGQSAKQWLMEHDINEKAYYYWLRKIRKNIYDQSVRSKTLPVILEESELTFAQLPDSYLKEHTASSSFEPVAVIKTTEATLAVSNGVSDQLLNQLFQVLSHAYGCRRHPAGRDCVRVRWSEKRDRWPGTDHWLPVWPETF